MSTITTTDFTIETSGYLSGSTHCFYAGQHNYLKVTRLATSTATSLYLKVGGYDAITYNLEADGTAEIDITSIIKVYEGESTTMKFSASDAGTAIAVYHGMHADAYRKMMEMTGDNCDYYIDNPFQYAILPNTIYRGVENITKALPTAYAIGNYTVFTSMNLSANLVTITSNAGMIKAQTAGGYEWSRRLLTTHNAPLVRVELTSALGRPAGDATLTGNKAVFYLELLSHKVDATITELQTIGDGYKAINEVTEQITIGLTQCTPYDYAYYMLMMLTAEDIEIDGEPCELVTKTANIQAGAVGKSNLSITLKRKNYVTI